MSPSVTMSPPSKKKQKRKHNRIDEERIFLKNTET